MEQRVCVASVGMVPFTRPGASDAYDVGSARRVPRSRMPGSTTAWSSRLTPIVNVNDNCATYGGRVVTNLSGGLLSKGHPLGATGLAQCAELVWQLRGEAGARQVEDVSLALQHKIGRGGACVVTLYEQTA